MTAPDAGSQAPRHQGRVRLKPPLEDFSEFAKVDREIGSISKHP
jgi:hypothetical protein